MSNRREFVAAASAGAMLGGLGTAPAAACTSAARRVGGSLSLAAFEALQGQDFVVRAAAGKRASLQLVAVREHASRQPLEQFSLVLRGDADRTLKGGMYVLEHAQSGGVQLRLDPSGQDELGPLYRADFSLLV
jgi:hypothetical protein